MLSVGNPGTISRHQVQITIMPAQNGVRIVIAAGVQLRANPAAMNKRPSGTIALEKLKAIAADREESVTVHQQSLRAARTEAVRDHFEAVENAVTVAINQAAHRVPVANQQPAFA